MYLEDKNIRDYNFFMLCNNYIISILEQADSKKWSEVKINFKEKDKKKVMSNKYDIFYFRNNGYATILNKSLYRHIIFSLVADYLIFIQDAIDCCLKGHFNTAYALLRKPFKDDLFIIELFYSSGHRIISKFVNKDISSFRIEKFTKEDKKKVLRKVCKKINFFTAKQLYDLRYSSNSYVGLEKFWNKAIHIVTTRKNHETENCNFNMIFYDDKEVDEQITYIYKVLCAVQLYFIVLISNILLEEKLITDEEYDFNVGNIFFSFFSIDEENNFNKEQQNGLLYKCRYCNHINHFDFTQMQDNFENYHFKRRCIKCNKIYNIEKFDFFEVQK